MESLIKKKDGKKKKIIGNENLNDGETIKSNEIKKLKNRKEDTKRISTIEKISEDKFISGAEEWAEQKSKTILIGGQKRKLEEILDVSIDPKKKLEENIELKQQQWAFLEKQKTKILDRINQLEEDLKHLPNFGKNRIKRGSAIIELGQLQDELLNLQKKDDFKVFVSCFAKWKKNKQAPITDEDAIALAEKAKQTEELEANHLLNSIENNSQNNLNESNDSLNSPTISNGLGGLHGLHGENSIVDVINKEHLNSIGNEDKSKEEDNEMVEVNLKKIKNKKKKSKSTDVKSIIRMKRVDTSFGIQITRDNKSIDQRSKHLAQWMK